MALAKSWFSIHPTNGKVHTAAQFNAKYNHNYREKTKETKRIFLWIRKNDKRYGNRLRYS